MTSCYAFSGNEKSGRTPCSHVSCFARDMQRFLVPPDAEWRLAFSPGLIELYHRRFDIELFGCIKEALSTTTTRQI